MKKDKKTLLNLLMAGLTVFSGCANNKKVNDIPNKIDYTVNTEANTKNIKYKDGDYEVTTAKDHEGYYCKAKVSIKDNKITNIEWNIYDLYNKIFDEKYEEVYAGNNFYQQQCRDDLKGAKTYGPKLVEVQNINKVDAISGATWSNRIFKSAIGLALEKAECK